MLRSAFLVSSLLSAHADNRPNLILMALDDLGWADVGYHSSDFPTPNMDELAKGGVRLEKYYVQQVCSPTRSALITARYPFRTGLQLCGTIMPGSSAHLPTDKPTLPEVLRDSGYSTAMIGKWHLGYASWDYTPTGRGFDSFAGYLQGQVDYVSKEIARGLDFWRNQTVARDAVGSYSMDFYMAEAKRVLDERDPSKPLFMYFAHQEIHIPLQAPPEERYAKACEQVVATGNRNTLCQMTSVLDESIGDFVSMLRERNMWDNTLLWVTTDNGGMVQWQDNFPASASSNYPLRAGKASLFEGGVRGISFVTGGFLPASASGREVHDLLQHVDIPATFAALAGTSFPLSDGYNVWKVIADGQPSPRNEVPVNIDVGSCNVGNVPANASFSALISGNWKIISGARGLYDGWWSNGDYTREDVSPTSENVTIDGSAVWLFDLSKDPNERENVALTFPDVVANLQGRLNELSDPSRDYVAPQDNSVNPLALPALHGGVWAPFQKAPITV